MTCKNHCERVRKKYKNLKLSKKGVETFSCNECSMYLPIEILDILYEVEEDIVNSIIKYKGLDKLKELQNKPRYCFCCGRKFSLRIRGSYVSIRKTQLEIEGCIRRI